MKLSPKFKTWLKRVGWVGFLFFLIKGILWLIAGKYILEFLFGK
jgi:hypothetical protein